MNVAEFEEAVWTLEGIRIAIRAPAHEELPLEHDFRNAANAQQSLTTFLRNRLYPYIGDREVIVIDGYGTRPNGNTHLQTIRQSYDH